MNGVLLQTCPRRQTKTSTLKAFLSLYTHEHDPREDTGWVFSLNLARSTRRYHYRMDYGTDLHTLWWDAFQWRFWQAAEQ